MNYWINFRNFLEFVEPIIAVPAIFLSLYIFFKDPLKRWVFLGYLPTAVLVIFDPNEMKMLLISNKGTIGFPQGGVFVSDVVQTVERTLKRELGIESVLIEIRYAKPLGTVKINDKYRTRKITLGSFSLASKIHGKGYIAYYVSTDIKKLQKKIKIGYDIDQYWILNIKDAKKRLGIKKTIDKKSILLLAAINDLENYLSTKTI
jgi:hypothetical protein